MATAMTRAQRLATIADSVMEAGALTVHELADRFRVSRMTIYRDLAALEAAGSVWLEQGKATARRSSFTETSSDFRATLRQALKQSLCEALRPILRRGQTIMLDDSSTVRPLIAMLGGAGPITLITHSQTVALEARQHPELRLILAGGAYNRALDSYYGLTTLSVLRSLRADLCVMSTAAIQRGVLYHPLEEGTAVKATMLEQSERRVLLVDHARFGHHATHVVARAGAFDDILVAGRPPREEMAALEELPAARVRRV